MNQKEDIFVNNDSSLLDVMKKMDKLDRKLLLVLKEKKYHGLISSGDIQRAIINGNGLQKEIDGILRKEVRVATPEDSYEDIRSMMIKFRMELCPVVNNDFEIESIYFWEDLFRERMVSEVTKFELPVVIMAGGFGTRLRPITNVLPKPLIPLRDKSMLEEIMDRFTKHGVNEFFISVNYKSDLIKFYLNSLNLPFYTECFIEPKPLGTAGSLSLLKGKVNTTFFVSNCDILIDEDYAEILKYHREHKNEITAVAAMKHYSIPYGTLETKEGGQLIGIDEKPDFTFMVNSGMYILEPHLLNDIPENKFFHITHLMEMVMNRKGRVGVFPVSEKSWMDMGEWPEYIKNMVASK